MVFIGPVDAIGAVSDKSNNEIRSHLVNEAMKFPWESGGDPDRYFGNYKDFLQRCEKLHLHEIVQYCEDMLVRKSTSRLSFFLQWVIGINVSLMTATTKLKPYTPLVYAILSGNHEIVKVLFEIEDMTSIV